MADYTKDQLAMMLADDFYKDTDVFTSGRRNNDAVDLCCLCRCLGFDAKEVFCEIAAEQKWDDRRYILAEEHVDRVIPYAESWGNPGEMTAMNYSIRY